MTTLALPPKYARTQQLRGLPSFADKSRLTTLDINQVPAPPLVVHITYHYDPKNTLVPNAASVYTDLFTLLRINSPA